MGLQESRFANVLPQMQQIWVIFTQLKLWVARSVIQSQVGENLNYIHYMYLALLKLKTASD